MSTARVRPGPPSAARAVLEARFRAALAAVDPAAAMRRALAGAAPPPGPPALLAVGKAAPAMAAAACAHWRACGLPVRAGLVVTHVAAPPPDAGITVLVGDHPIPGERSHRAAEAVGRFLAALPPDVPVEVLVSGGTSALIGAPRTGGDWRAFAGRSAHWVASGGDIHAVNTARRREARWAAGRMADALGARPVRAWLVSDVPDDRLDTIGSGPLVHSAAVAPAIPHTIVASGAMARAGALNGWHGPACEHAAALAGDAAEAGRRIARLLLATQPVAPTLHAWSGETTVALPADAGHGGRSQQLALAAARELAAAGPGSPVVTLLAAGTDGRDGPTDAAGAVVDATTWGAVRAAGHDPRLALRRCDAHAPLAAAGALLRTGPTGTNVADLVLALVAPG